jgi:hypothetical protein
MKEVYLLMLPGSMGISGVGESDGDLRKLFNFDSNLWEISDRLVKICHIFERQVLVMIQL